MRRPKLLLIGVGAFAAAGLAITCTKASSQAAATDRIASPCQPPEGFVDVPPPPVLPFDRLVRHEETVVIDAPLVRVLAAAKAAALEDTIQENSGLPHVTGTYMLTPGAFESAGARRITCLSDGSTLVEQILERRETTNPAEFRYVVWNYTSRSARPVDYGVGRFIHRQLADDRTEVIWTYGFRLRRDRWPGFLGFIGDFLFEKFFLERDYARMMRSTLSASKVDVEQQAPGP